MLHLPASTLAIFDSDAGAFSRYLQYDDPARTKLKRVGVVLKAPQKREIANYALSCSYEVSTGITTGLLYGTNVPCFDEKISDASSSLGVVEEAIRQSRESIHPPRMDVKPTQLILTAAQRSDHGRYAPLVTSLESAAIAWSHPLLLPCIVLTEHMRRTKLFCNVGEVMQETWAIEGELGVTYVGRQIERNDAQQLISEALEGKKSSPFTASRREQKQTKSWQVAFNTQNKLSRSGIIGREQAEKLTVRINTQSLRILFTARSPQWNSQCSHSMRSLMDELASPLGGQLDTASHDALKELLEYNISTAESVGSHVASMKERMALQLDVLYSMVAQMDNRLTARLAASSGRDSTSMKILAFITALYLPATTVAQLFSMSMFAWPHKGDGSGTSGGGSQVSVVSNWFWLYWAVTIPLTIVTLGGWGIWWMLEMRRFKKSYAEALGEAEDPTSAPVGATKSLEDEGQPLVTVNSIRGQESISREVRARVTRRKLDVEEAATAGSEKLSS